VNTEITAASARMAGKVAVVTGGADGIGRGITEMLAQHGAKVSIFDVREEAGALTAAELAEQGLQVTSHAVDVTNEDSVAAAMEAVWDTWGALHVLVNNAGVSGPPEPTDKVDLAAWQSMFAVNVQGPFLCTKHAIPYQRRTPGGKSIVSISSIYGLIGNADSPSYHSAKGAVRLMAKTDAVTYAPEGIRVNSVCPGSIMTALNLRKAEETPGYLDEMIALHPIGQIGEPEDIAYGVLYLASDESRFVTGTELIIDGGYTAQ
jgi:NAD(P)-dependent dehydrogenase (short-subunit alcohol dehydrogenase family)